MNEKKTIGLLLIAVSLSGCATLSVPDRDPVDFWEHEFDGRNWELAHEAANSGQQVSEWLVEGDDIDDWEELLTASSYSDAAVDDIVFVFTRLMKRDCPDIDIETDKNNQIGFVVYWEHDGCGRFGPQKEIRRSQQGRDGVYNLAYAVKKRSYQKSYYDKWKDLILSAVLRPVEETRQAYPHE